MLPGMEESGDTYVASTQPENLVDSADTQCVLRLRGGSDEAAAAGAEGSDLPADPPPPPPSPEPMQIDEVPCPITIFQNVFPLASALCYGHRTALK